MSHKLSNLDMKDLGDELESAIQEDKKYWLQNEAKLKAVSDHVETYNEFKNLVDTAHLKPLDKTDKLNKDKLNHSIWNKFAQNCSSDETCNENSKQSPECSKPKEELSPSTTSANRDNFLDILNASKHKFSFLMELGAPRFVEIFQNEISSSTLVEVCTVLLSLDRNNIDNIVFVTEFLGELINIERFTLTLSFLTSEEKQTVESLFEKLNSCFILKSSELNEFGLCEDHLSALKIVYQV